MHIQYLYIDDADNDNNNAVNKFKIMTFIIDFSCCCSLF